MKYHEINIVGKCQLQRVSVTDMTSYVNLKARIVFNEIDKHLWYCDADEAATHEPGHWHKIGYINDLDNLLAHLTILDNKDIDLQQQINSLSSTVNGIISTDNSLQQQITNLSTVVSELVVDGGTF